MDFRNTKIQRLIIHKIKGKDNFTNATAEFTDNLIAIDQEIEKIIRKRVTDACGKPSKSFIVEIEDKTDETKFFHHAQKMKEADDNQFVEISKELANNLAGNQTTKNATEGYLLVIQGKNIEINTNFFILIKASFDDAVKPSNIDGKTIMEFMNDVILSSNQKLFKIGIISEFVDDSKNSVDYECILFDDQIRNGSKPAEYFAKGFLGFQVEHNPKYQTEKFFEDVRNFVKSKIKDGKQK